MTVMYTDDYPRGPMRAEFDALCTVHLSDFQRLIWNDEIETGRQLFRKDVNIAMSQLLQSTELRTIALTSLSGDFLALYRRDRG